MADEDLALIKRFQSGDATAFEPLVSKYKDKIYDLAYYYTHDVEDAYDLSQEVFERAFKALGGFRRRSSFYTWLYRIAKNAGIDYVRRRSRLQTVPIEEWVYSHESFSTGADDSPAGEVELDELRHQIARAIDQLPPKQKAVFIMKRQQELSLEEIAQILGRSVGTIKAHLSHATHKLMNLLEPYLKK